MINNILVKDHKIHTVSQQQQHNNKPKHVITTTTFRCNINATQLVHMHVVPSEKNSQGISLQQFCHQGQGISLQLNAMHETRLQQQSHSNTTTTTTTQQRFNVGHRPTT